MSPLTRHLFGEWPDGPGESPLCRRRESPSSGLPFPTNSEDHDANCFTVEVREPTPQERKESADLHIHYLREALYGAIGLYRVSLNNLARKEAFDPEAKIAEEVVKPDCQPQQEAEKWLIYEKS